MTTGPAGAKYVYGVVRASAADTLDAVGLGGQPLDVVSVGDVGALTSGLAAEPLEAGREELLAHARALERAFEHGPVLPMRFGIVMENEQAVRDELLAAHREQLEAQLDEMDGKVEVSLKGIYDESSILSEVVAGNAEVAALKEAIANESEEATYPERIRLGELVSAALEAKREADSDAIVEQLAAHAIAVDVGEPVHERMAVSCSFLIERERLEDFDRELEALADRQGGRIRFNYVGPLPPHSFVELTLEA